MSLTVACVLRSGGAYTGEYVERLRAGVTAHLSGFRWRCLSDVPEVATDPLPRPWPGWWCKINLFAPGLFDGPVLYFDLDTVICGDLSEITAAAEREPFVMLQDFLRINERRALGSGMMAWQGDYSAVFHAFAADPDRHQRQYRSRDKWGDQGFIRDHIGVDPARWQEAVPGQVVSYKAGVKRHGRLPDGARVVCFHGRPRPHEVGWRV